MVVVVRLGLKMGSKVHHHRPPIVEVWMSEVALDGAVFWWTVDEQSNVEALRW